MNKYSDLEKLLNNQFLGDTELSRYLFKRNFGKTSNKKVKKIFITGLARSGTTALLNQIFAMDEIASIQYKHMPFVLSPRLSKIISKYIISSTQELKKERLHGDNIYISHNSPECLDEPFWIKENNKYFKEPLNSKTILTKDSIDAYGYFLDKHALMQGKKYIVIKNNNNHIRILKLANHLRNSIFIVLFRNPINQSLSLLNTHKRISGFQKKDKYIIEYMNLVGHREFGINQIYFKYDEFSLEKLQNSCPEGNSSINYWIQSWINTYGWLSNINVKENKNIFFVSYEDLCLKNNSILNKIFNLIDLDYSKQNLLINKNSKNDKFQENRLIKQANQIYEKLKENSLK